MSEAGVITLALAVISAIISAVVWAVRVEGIVRAHEQQIAQMRHDVNSKIDLVITEVRYIRKRIDGIER